MPRIPKTPKQFTLSDYLQVIREYGFCKYEPRAGMIGFEPASGFTLKLAMKVADFMGDATIVVQWSLFKAGELSNMGGAPSTLAGVLRRSYIPKFDAALESDIAKCYSGCMKALKANSTEHEYAISKLGKSMVLVVIGEERIGLLREILTGNEQPFPA